MGAGEAQTGGAELAARIEALTGWTPPRPVRILTDTSDAMSIARGEVLDLGGHLYVVLGHAYESRFGILDQPKYWVLRAVDLATGAPKIIKTVFHEEFVVRIGTLRIRCYRSPEKEGRVLDLVRGDNRFMQGETVLDSRGDRVRVIDQISGPSIYNHIMSLAMPHEAYFFQEAPGLLRRLLDSMAAIQFLHDHELCHGDIRNDHIIIEKATGRFRWIDFDLAQDFSDFDIWSIGNVLSFTVGQGIQSFHQVLKATTIADSVKESLTAADASAFYEYRIMNLRKLFPYVPELLNNVLLRFTAAAETYYTRMDQVLDDLREALDACLPGGATGAHGEATGDGGHAAGPRPVAGDTP